jgi:hypothetical protein
MSEAETDAALAAIAVAEFAATAAEGLGLPGRRTRPHAPRGASARPRSPRQRRHGAFEEEAAERESTAAPLWSDRGAVATTMLVVVRSS